jgi:predicted metal-dependent peptidase
MAKNPVSVRKDRKTTKAIDPLVHEAVVKKIAKGRIKLLRTAPFFGIIITKMQIFPADEWCDTMAVDGRHLYFNHAFVNELNEDELLFVFAHEVLHIVYDHISRTRDYKLNHEISNCAQDYTINGELDTIKIGKMPSIGLMDHKYDGMTSEQVYALLMKNTQQMSIDDLVNQLIDEHLDGEQGKDGKNGDGPSASGPAKMSADEREQIKSEIISEVLNAAKMSQAGSLPLGVQRMVDALTAPKIDWRSLLRTELAGLKPYDYSYMKPSRYGWDLDAIMPGIINDNELDVAVFLDMSGSIGSKEATEFLSEVKGIMGAYNSFTVHVGCWDTKVYNVQKFTEYDDDLESYEILGGGGTDVTCVFDYIKDVGMQPKKVIVFTDGYLGGRYGDPNVADTLWVLNTKDGEIPDFGLVCYYDPNI